jgi:C-8 sterol isomerase
MTYLFDPDRLHEATKKAVGLPNEDAFDLITRELHDRYPGHIRTEPRRWIFNNAGGAMGQIAILHASLSEYILIFGTPIGTEGHSGRYATEVWDFMIAGEMWCYHEGESQRISFKPGDAAYLGKSRVKGYRVPDHAWMLEYARGPVATMLPFGVADTVTSTLDVRNLARTFWQYTQLVTKELAQGKV